MAKSPADIAVAIAALQQLTSSELHASDPKFGIDELPSEVWGCIVPLAMDKIGCRVLQSALDGADSGCRTAMASELRGNIRKAVDSQHANHVVQRAVELIAPESVRFIVLELSQD